MTELTAEKRAELREMLRAGGTWGPALALSLLDALDAAEAKLLELQTLIRDASGAGDQL